MKKIVLALLCVAFVAFTGCKKDKAPTVKFITTGNYTNPSTELHVGEKAVFGVEAVSDMFAGKGINKITVSYSNGDPDQVFAYDPVEDSPSNSWVKTFDAPGKVTLTATAYDDNGENGMATMTVTVLEAAPDPDPEPVPEVHKPVISFLSNGEYVGDGTPLYTQTSYKFGVAVATDGAPQAPLIKKVDVKYSNDNGIYNVYNNSEGEATIPEVAWNKTFAEPGTITITATVTDAAGETASASISVLVTTLPEPDDNPFIGAYANENLKVTGHISLAMPPLNQDIDYDLPGGGFVINPGETDDAVVVTMLIDGTEYNMNATISGNTITFEETEVELDTRVSNTNVKIRAMLGGTGILDNGVIDYHGVIGETVYVSVYTFTNIQATVTNGKLEGEFTKLPPTK